MEIVLADESLLLLEEIVRFQEEGLVKLLSVDMVML